MTIDITLIERWLTGWSLSRGLPLPTPYLGGLTVEVGKPEQLQRYVFADAGPDLQACAAEIHGPHIFLKAAVDIEAMRHALPAHWRIEAPGYLMASPLPIAHPVEAPPGYSVVLEQDSSAHVANVIHETGEKAASGRVALSNGCAVFDQIVTAEGHRRRGLGSIVMQALDTVAQQAGAHERLLVATEEGRALYTHLGWRVLAPWSTAVLPLPCVPV